MPLGNWRRIFVGALAGVAAILVIQITPATASAPLMESQRAALATGHVALAQGGSIGGSVGVQNKSISGSRSVPESSSAKPATRHKRERSSDRHHRERSSSRSTHRFDGTWATVATGNGCRGSGVSTVSGGRISAEGTTGHVTANGSVSAVYRANGVTVTYTGHLSGHSGSGSFRQSDGCVGRWTAVKQ